MKILVPYFSCLIFSPTEGSEQDELQEAIGYGYQQIYISTPNGFFKHHLLRPGKDGKSRYIRTPVLEVPGVKFKKVESSVQFLPDGKVPIRLLDEVKAFFKQIIIHKSTAVEAMIWVLWNEEKGYYLHVPNQTVGKASANYDWSSLPVDSSVIVDIHSHADFGAFFSSTDDRDDSNAIRFSVVIGNNDKPTPTTKARFNYLGIKTEVDLDVIFSERVIDPVTTPQEWLDQVKTHTPTVSTYQYSGRRMDSHPGFVRNGGQGNFSHGGFPHTGPQTLMEMSGTTHYRGHIPDTRTYTDDKDDDSPVGRKLTKKEKKKLSGEQKTNLVQAGDANFIEVPERYKNMTVGGLVYLNGRRYRRTSEGLELYMLDIPNPVVVSSIPNVVPKGELCYVNGNTYEQTSSGLRLVKENSHPSNSIENGINAEEVRARTNFTGFYEEYSIDNMHKAAARQAQEDILGRQEDELSEQAEQHLGSVETIEVHGETITAMDIPPNFDEIACNHGVDVAKAYSLIDKASVDLIGAHSVLSTTVSDLFQLVDEERKLELFKELFQSLPKAAKVSIQGNGI
jgi:PRTRC genetic system protein A